MLAVTYRRSASVVLAGLLLLTVGAGGALAQDPSNPAASGGPDTPVSGSPGAEPVEPGPVAIPAVPDPTVTNVTPTGWDHITVAPDGQTLTVYFWNGAEACFGLQAVEVTPGADGTPPSITLLTGLRADAINKRCTAIAQLYSTVVVLDAPILGGGNADGPSVPVVTEDEAQLVVPDPTVGDLHARGWEYVTFSADGRTATVYFWDGVDACYGLGRVDVTSTDGLTTITPFTGTRPQAANTACIEIAVLFKTVVVLDAPVISGGLV